MIGKYGSFIVISLLAVLACPPALASEIGEYELVATWGSLGADDGRFNDPTGLRSMVRGMSMWQILVITESRSSTTLVRFS